MKSLLIKLALSPTINKENAKIVVTSSENGEQRYIAVEGGGYKYPVKLRNISKLGKKEEREILSSYNSLLKENCKLMVFSLSFDIEGSEVKYFRGLIIPKSRILADLDYHSIVRMVINSSISEFGMNILSNSTITSSIDDKFIEDEFKGM